MAKWRWPLLLPRRGQWGVWMGRWGCTEPLVLSSSPLDWSGHPVDSALWVTNCLLLVVHAALEHRPCQMAYGHFCLGVSLGAKPAVLKNSLWCLKLWCNRFGSWSKHLLCQVFSTSSLSLYWTVWERMLSSVASSKLCCYISDPRFACVFTKLNYFCLAFGLSSLDCELVCR